MIFQNPAATSIPVMRIGDQIAESLRHHEGAERRTRRATAPSTCCARSAFPIRRRRVDAYPHEFSGGMRQRVMIALALACGPNS